MKRRRAVDIPTDKRFNVHDAKLTGDGNEGRETAHPCRKDSRKTDIYSPNLAKFTRYKIFNILMQPIFVVYNYFGKFADYLSQSGFHSSSPPSLVPFFSLSLSLDIVWSAEIFQGRLCYSFLNMKKPHFDCHLLEIFQDFLREKKVSIHS